MDFLKLSGALKEKLKNCQAVFLVVLAGIFLMLLPNRESSPKPQAKEIPTLSFQQELEQVLSCIQGAGTVKLLLSPESGELTLYQSDEDLDGDGGGRRKNTVIISGENRQEQGLIRQVTAPKYRGAVVIAEGADRSPVKLALINAVSKATGLRSDKITVLKMK